MLNRCIDRKRDIYLVTIDLYGETPYASRKAADPLQFICMQFAHTHTQDDGRERRNLESVKNSDFSAEELKLIADTARRLQPNLKSLAERWAQKLPIDAPEDKRAAIRATVATMGLEFLRSLFERLANGDPEGAIAEYGRIQERQMRERMRPAPAGRAR
jgi:hypothetical protein